MRPLKLIPIFHDSLTPGESPEAMDRIVEHAWRPMLELLHEHPKVRVVLHPSGTLLEWMRAHHPGALDSLQSILGRGQVELLGGAHYGAVLHLLPERDALAQLRRHQSWLRRHLDLAPRGAWLTAGAWDPSIPRILVKAGFQYTFVDGDVIGGGGPAVRPGGSWYVAERRGATIGLFALDRELSAMVPWARLHVLHAELRARLRAGQVNVVLSVPLERLGASASAREWCWTGTRGWMRGFFELLSREEQWLQVRQAGEVLDHGLPAGRAYPASSTPAELGVEALPVQQGREFARWWSAARDAREAGRPWPLRWMPGPRFELFLERYDAANRLHKRMLRTSNIVHTLRRRSQAVPDDTEVRSAVSDSTRALHWGQAAAYLHGAAGGCLPRGEMRHAAWRALLDAEQLADEALGNRGRLRHEVVDYDCDGQNEVVVTNPRMQAVVRPSAGGALAELNLWGHGNLVNTLARTEEAWHDDLSRTEQLPALVDEATDEVVEVSIDDGTDEVASVGALSTQPPLLPLEPDLDSLLVPDRTRRLCLQDHFIAAGLTLRNLQLGQHPQIGDFLDAPYRFAGTRSLKDGGLAVSMERDGTAVDGDTTHLLRIVKRLRFHPREAIMLVDYELRNRYFEPVRCRFGVELNFNLDSQLGDKRWIELPNRDPVPFDTAGEFPGADRLALVMADRGIKLRIWSGRPAHVYVYPVRTPVRTPDGYVSAFQGTCVFLAWDLELWGEEKTVIDLNLRVADL